MTSGGHLGNFYHNSVQAVSPLFCITNARVYPLGTDRDSLLERPQMAIYHFMAHSDCTGPGMGQGPGP